MSKAGLDFVLIVVFSDFTRHFIKLNNHKYSMSYKIYTTPEFDRLFRELSKSEQKEVEKLMKIELPENPYQGRALGLKFFREKRVGGKRVYFLIYDDYVIVLMVAIGDKKTQEKDIDQLKINRKQYLKLAEDLSRIH